MKFALLGFLVVLCITFIVMLVKSAKQIRWYYHVVMVLNLGLVIGLLFPTAVALKSRMAWHDLKETLEARAADLEAEHDLILKGDESDPSIGIGLRQLRHEYSWLNAEVGFHVAGMTGAQQQAGTFTLKKSAPQPVVDPSLGMPATPDPAASAPKPTKPMFPTDSVVYAFLEEPLEQGQTALPRYYVGEFKVSQSTPDTVTIQAQGQLEQIQRQMLANSGNRTWTVYEMLPLDGHQPFLLEGSDKILPEDNIFGSVDKNLVAQLFSNRNVIGNMLSATPLVEGKPSERELYLANMDASTVGYLNDGQKIEQQTNLPPEANRWSRVQFQANYEDVVDSQDAADPADVSAFDILGKAKDIRLHVGDGEGKVVAKKGDFAVVDFDTQKEWENNQVAVVVGTFFVRSLVDFRFEIRRLRIRVREVADRIKVVQEEHTLLESAQGTLIKLLAQRQEIILKLEDDIAQVEVENTALDDYLAKQSEALRKLQEKASLLYRENISMMEELEAYASGQKVDET